jgi:hypothetical protein
MVGAVVVVQDISATMLVAMEAATVAREFRMIYQVPQTTMPVEAVVEEAVAGGLPLVGMEAAVAAQVLMPWTTPVQAAVEEPIRAPPAATAAPAS